MARQKKITPVQMRFVEEYCEDPSNGAAAMERAKPGCNNAKQRAHQYLHDPRYDLVQEEIAKRLEKAAKKANLSTDRLMYEESCLAYSDIRQIFDDEGTPVSPKELPEDVARAISSVWVEDRYTPQGEFVRKYRYSFWNKGEALKRVESYMGLHIKNVALENKDGEPFKTENTTRLELSDPLANMIDEVVNDESDEQED